MYDQYVRSFSMQLLISLITRTTLHFMLVNQIWTLFWVNLKKTPLQFLQGFRTTTLKQLVENHVILTTSDNINVY